MKNKAFTLVEVVMAMAVTAFALMAIVGLLPLGLKSMHDSQNDQAITAITYQLRDEFQQIPFTNTGPIISNLTNYYSVEGSQVTDLTNPQFPPYYIATFAVTNSGVNGSSYQISNSAQIITTIISPYSSPRETNVVSMLETKQSGLSTK